MTTRVFRLSASPLMVMRSMALTMKIKNFGLAKITTFVMDDSFPSWITVTLMWPQARTHISWGAGVPDLHNSSSSYAPLTLVMPKVQSLSPR